MYSTSCQLLEKVSKLVFLMLILCNSLHKALDNFLFNLNNVLVLLISIGKQTKSALNDELELRGAEEKEEAVARVLSHTGVKSGKLCLP